MNKLYLKKLEWDSNHFGFNIATLNANLLDSNKIDLVIKESIFYQIKCIYCLVNPNQLDLIHALSDYKFRFIDVRVLFTLSIEDVEFITEDELNIASSDDLAIILNWVESYHQDSRFFKDKNFEFSKSQNMYSIWVNKFFNSESGSVLVFRNNGILVGYIVVSVGENNNGKIELIGVSENYRGMGYGEKIVNLSFKWFKSKGVNNVTVITQGSNIPAIRLYSKIDFLPYEIDHWYHFWS